MQHTRPHLRGAEANVEDDAVDGQRPQLGRAGQQLAQLAEAAQHRIQPAAVARLQLQLLRGGNGRRVAVDRHDGRAQLCPPRRSGQGSVT